MAECGPDDQAIAVMVEVVRTEGARQVAERITRGDRLAVHGADRAREPAPELTTGHRDLLVAQSRFALERLRSYQRPTLLIPSPMGALGANARNTERRDRQRR